MLLRPWRNAASTCEEAAREPLRRYPITGIGCRCARVTPGQATAAPPSSVMNVRRLMGLSLQPHSASRGYHIQGDACCASQQISAAHVGCGSGLCENSSARRARRNISKKLRIMESNRAPRTMFDTLFGDCIFYISQLYEFSHRLGHKRKNSI